MKRYIKWVFMGWFFITAVPQSEVKVIGPFATQKECVLVLEHTFRSWTYLVGQPPDILIMDKSGNLINVGAHKYNGTGIGCEEVK